ncbi:hypothetical protein, partial [Escherichia coli]|uniref:hypothetical protein n=2 Tax=Escherichia coli TaxID=562 RepID=UPI001BA6BEDA
KTPSYTKSVSWQHHLVCANKMKLRIFFEIKMSIPLPRILVRLTVSVSLSLMKPRAKIGDYVMVLQKITEKGGNIG